MRGITYFPGLAIQWGAVGDVGLVAEMQEEHTELVIAGTSQQRIRNCLSVMDKFLRQSDSLVSSMIVANKRAEDASSGNVIVSILNILGIRDIKSISIHATLTEIGMDSIMAVEIKQTMEREFQVILSPQDIRRMTIAKLQEMAVIDNKTKIVSETGAGEMKLQEEGLQLMFRTLGDEETARKSSIVLASAASKDCTDHIYMIPGIEGMASVLEPLAKHLNVIPICLQLGVEILESSIQEMAQSLLEKSSEYFPDSSPTFTLVGYSYGSVIALEIASILESRGKIGRIILIDGSPNMLKALSNQRIQSKEEVFIQNLVLDLMCNLIYEAKTAVFLKRQYENIETWQQKVNKIFENIEKINNYSIAYLKTIIESIYNRFKAFMLYNPTMKQLESSIKLIKPKQPTVIMEAEDFGLSAYTNRPVEIVYCEGNHITILDNPDCATEIIKGKIN